MTSEISTWPNVAFDYSTYNVLVTGGSNGIGLAIAQAYLKAGANVTITGTRDRASDYNHDLSGLVYEQLQVSDNAAIDALAEKLPTPLDILINNAGASFPGGADEWEPDVFAQSLQINLISAFRLASKCLNQLKASDKPGGASVIGIASMTSYFGNTIVPGYGAAKAGLVQMTKTLAMKWAADSIRVNAVAAGLTRSNMTAGMLDHMQDMVGDTLRRTPAGRVGEPLDIAGPVLFLTSPAATYVTGQTLPVDGGYTVSGEP
ncbi:MAG: SDR family NAD(P)-dependent oxidoreductase [Pseudomonadales bacterium]